VQTTGRVGAALWVVVVTAVVAILGCGPPKPTPEPMTTQAPPPSDPDEVFKVVYYGPGGTLPSLEYIKQRVEAGGGEGAGKLVGVEDTDTAWWMWWFYPSNLGPVRGKRVLLHVYAVTGADPDGSPVDDAIKGTDGVVFVVNRDLTNPQAHDANFARLVHLRGLLRRHGIDPTQLPWVFQYNGPLPTDEPATYWMRTLTIPDDSGIEVVPETSLFVSQPDGTGVFPPLKEVVRQILVHYKTTGERPSQTFATP
jgi:hypothetical protein